MFGLPSAQEAKALGVFPLFTFVLSPALTLCSLTPSPPFVFIFHPAAFAFPFLGPVLVPCLPVRKRRLVRFLHLFINFNKKN